MKNTAKGWYPDPDSSGPNSIRYWDGDNWTLHTATRVPSSDYALDDHELTIAPTADNLAILEKEIKIAQASLNHCRSEIFDAEDLYAQQLAGIYDRNSEGHDATAYSRDIESIRSQYLEILRLGNAVVIDESYLEGVPPRLVEILAENTSKLCLRAYNNELDLLLLTVTADNVDNYLVRADNAAKTVSLLSGDLHIEITEDYQELRKREVYSMGRFKGVGTGELPPKKEEKTTPAIPSFNS